MGIKKKIVVGIGCVMLVYIGQLIYNYWDYKLPKEHQVKLKEYCRRNNANPHCIIVDFGRYSGNCRMWLYDVENDRKIKTLGRVAQGMGKEPEDLFFPKFSNVPNSWNSSLGKYRLGRIRTMQFHGLHVPCIEVHGLDPTNSNAHSRGILIHPGLLTSLPTITPCEPFSQGCFTVGSDMYDFIEKILKRSNKPLILYAFK